MNDYGWVMGENEVINDSMIKFNTYSKGRPYLKIK